MKWKALLVLSIFVVAGCVSPLELGNQQYAVGNYDRAAVHWNPLAINGNPYAQYNLGLLWESGLGSTPKNTAKASEWFLRSAKQGFAPAMVKLANLQFLSGYDEAAISWLNLAARWGNQAARNSLAQKGLEIPYPDLYEKKQQEDAIAAQNLALVMSSALNAYSDYSSSSSASSMPQIYQQPPRCTSDFSCGVGFQCVKAPLKSEGICMKAVDQFGLPQNHLPNTDSIGPNMNTLGQCISNIDCPIGFTCDSKLKACIKR